MKNNKVESERWLKEAETDLKAAELLFDKKMYNLTCFHCEQCIQKSLKAFLYFQGERFVPIHSVHRLIIKCIEYDIEFNKFKEDIIQFDKYYIPTRYPDALPFPEVPSEIYTEKEAKESIRVTKELYDFVSQKIK